MHSIVSNVPKLWKKNRSTVRFSLTTVSPHNAIFLLLLVEQSASGVWDISWDMDRTSNGQKQTTTMAAYEARRRFMSSRKDTFSIYVHRCFHVFRTLSPSLPRSSCLIFIFLFFSAFSPPSFLLLPPLFSLCLYDKAQQLLLSLSLSDSLQCNYTDCPLKHDTHTHTLGERGDLFTISVVVIVLF